MYSDISGYWLETAIDIVSVSYSLYQVYENPTDWRNWAWLCVDIVFAVVPILTGSGALRGVNRLDDISDISKMATYSDEVIVIGQSMNIRVIPEALNLGADYYRGFNQYNDMARVSNVMADMYGYADNMKFIASRSFTGYKFIDIGMDVSRVGGKGIVWSKFTIYSERIIATTFRKKNIVRAGYWVYDYFS